MFEAYTQVNEASLITVKHGEANAKPMVGLSLEEMDKTKRETLFLEVQQSFKAETSPIVVSDARMPGSPHAGLFKEANPFYIKQLKSDNG